MSGRSMDQYSGARPSQSRAPASQKCQKCLRASDPSIGLPLAATGLSQTLTDFSCSLRPGRLWPLHVRVQEQGAALQGSTVEDAAAAVGQGVEHARPAVGRGPRGVLAKVRASDVALRSDRACLPVLTPASVCSLLVLQKGLGDSDPRGPRASPGREGSGRAQRPRALRLVLVVRLVVRL